MKRRDFLWLFLSALPMWSLAKEFKFSKMDFERWVWMHPDCSLSDEALWAYLKQLKALGIEKIHLEVYTGTKAFFKSALPGEQPCDLLQRILPQAHKLGMQVHAWIWTLMNDHPQMLEEHRDWYVVNRLGQSCIDHPPYVKHYRWLCPTKPQVREYLLQLIRELSAYPDLDGIHLDYIRFPDVILPIGFQPKYHLVQKSEMPEYDFCYCPTCRDAFKKQNGFDPLDLEDPSKNLAWRAFREGQITELVNLLVREIKNHGKTVTAAVFPTPTIARKLVRQNWPNWKVDAFFPMMYHPFYHQPVPWLYEATREGVHAIAVRQKLYSGIYVPAFKPEEMEQALSLIQKAGGAGVAFFDDHSLIKHSELQRVLRTKSKEK